MCVHDYMLVPMQVYTWAWMWISEDKITCLFQLLSTLGFEIGLSLSLEHTDQPDWRVASLGDSCIPALPVLGL